MAVTSPGGPFRRALLTAVTSGQSQPVNCRGFLNLAVYITATAALSAGTLIIEEATWAPDTAVPYGGTWSQIASYDLSSIFASSGGQSAQHLQAAAYANVRARIGTTVVDGTVSVALESC